MRKIAIIFFQFLIFSFLLINAFHESYLDEFDNILGGAYILQGQEIYKDFFTHHGPLAYYLSAFVLFLSGHSFVKFRIIWAILLFLSQLIIYFYLRKKKQSIKPPSLQMHILPVFLGFVLVLVTAMTYFWGQMVLADTVSAYLFVIIYAFIIFKNWTNQSFNRKDLIFVSVLTSAVILTSFSYFYLVFFTDLYVLYLFLRNKTIGIKILKEAIIGSMIFLLPYLLFLTLLFLSGSFKDFWQQAYVFNSKYYIYNYPRVEGASQINPLRYALVIFNDFYRNFLILISSIKDLKLGEPFNTSLAIAALASFVFFLFKKKYLLVFWLMSVYTFANVRSNPFEIAETDYQSSVWIVVNLFNASFLFCFIKERINAIKFFNFEKLVLSFCSIIFLIFWSFNILFLFQKFEVKAFNKYMGYAPLIYDRPEISPLLNTILDKDDYAWIGPFEFKELFYLKAKKPSKYHILLPAFGKSDEIQKEFLADFNQNKPKVIYFDKGYYMLGQEPHQYAVFFMEWLNTNYITLVNETAQDGRHYNSVAPLSLRVDLEAKLYISKDKKDEVINKLLEKNLIYLK